MKITIAVTDHVGRDLHLPLGGKSSKLPLVVIYGE